MYGRLRSIKWEPDGHGRLLLTANVQTGAKRIVGIPAGEGTTKEEFQAAVEAMYERFHPQGFRETGERT